MPPFKVKDLMINDLSEPAPGRHENRRLPKCGPSVHPQKSSTGLGTCFVCFGSHDPFARFDPEVSPESLKALREQLKQQIEEIDQQEAILEQKLPQTVEEVDKPCRRS